MLDVAEHDTRRRVLAPHSERRKSEVDLVGVTGIIQASCGDMVLVLYPTLRRMPVYADEHDEGKVTSYTMRWRWLSESEIVYL